MSTNRKALKIVSLLQVLAALGAAALGAIALFGADLAEAEAGVLGVLVVYLDGVLYLVCAVLTFFCAVMGIHGASACSRSSPPSSTACAARRPTSKRQTLRFFIRNHALCTWT